MYSRFSSLAFSLLYLFITWFLGTMLCVTQAGPQSFPIVQLVLSEGRGNYIVYMYKTNYKIIASSSNRHEYQYYIIVQSESGLFKNISVGVVKYTSQSLEFCHMWKMQGCCSFISIVHFVIHLGYQVNSLQFNCRYTRYDNVFFLHK